MKLDISVVLAPPPVEGEELANRWGAVSSLLLPCEEGQNPKKANRNHSNLKRAECMYGFSRITVIHNMYHNYVSETVIHKS